MTLRKVLVLGGGFAGLFGALAAKSMRAMGLPSSSSGNPHPLHDTGRGCQIDEAGVQLMDGVPIAADAIYAVPTWLQAS